MRQAWHIFKKDTRYLWREICLVLGLTAIFAWTDPWWMPIMLLPAGSFLIARAIHAEAIPGDRQFWITRPYRWKSLLGAKLLFVLVYVNLPIALSQLKLLAAAGFPLAASIPGLLWSLLLMVLMGSIPVIALATMTPSIVAFIFPTLVLATVWFSAALFARPVLPGESWPPAVDWVRDTIMVTVLAALLLAILYVQYRSRLTRLGRAIAISGAVLIGAGYWLLPWAPAWAIESRFSKETMNGAIEMLPNPVEMQAARVMNRSWIGVQVGLPIVVRSVPDGVDFAVDDAMAVTFQGSNGRTLKSTTGSAIWRPARPGTAAIEATTLLDWAFYREVSQEPVTVRGSFYLTVFGNPRAKTIPLRHTPVYALDGLQCYLGAFGQVNCQSAFRWPARLVYADTSPLTEFPSYSPFPATLALDPLVTHWAPSLPVSADEVTITVKEPLAHIRRDFELRGVRLPRISGVN